MAQNDDSFSDLIRSLEQNLQRGEDWRPPDEDAPTRERGNPRRYLWFLIPLLIFIFFNQIIGFVADWFWYDSLDLTSVLFTRIVAKMGLFLAGAVLFWLIVAFNVWLARRISPNGLYGTALEETVTAFGIRVVPTILVAAAILAFFVGISTASAWESVLLFLNQSNFGLSDPIFGRDVGFFIFTLPIWQLIRSWMMFTLIVALVGAALVSGIGWHGWDIRTRALVHLGALGALILVLIAWQYRINAYQLVYSTRGAVFGAGFADERAQLPAYNLLAIVTLITAVALMVTVFRRRAWRATVAVLIVWAAAAVLAGNIFPSFVQRFRVSPNELALERPYIENNIEFTRRAFDLDEIVVQDYVVDDTVTAAEILAEADTLSNVRLWDYRPLLQTYNQIQALRQYYQFNDIDIDRYELDDGSLRQVMVAGRELVADQLSDDAQTWVNQRLVYTHGYGVAASSVSQVTRDGLPDFYLKDIPTQGVITVTRPQLYFGELTNNYVIGRTDEPEFGYPSGDGNVMTQFDADTGIETSFLARLLFAVRFADINLVLNGDIHGDSQLLWRRNIRERVQQVAPFLRYDQDPYIVVDESGELWWILDAYTVSNRFPYSDPLESINYIRNSVKITINAYDGTMTFYVVDEEEPIIAAYREIFPSLFTTFDQMPEDLAKHVRYPVDMFTIQALVYRTYHMTDPNEFYNREDMWAWPEELFEDQPQQMQPYYVLMQLPGEDKLEFMQILPFTPANRENMISWMSAKSDPENYGDMLVFEFGKDALFFGPKQIEARIDQDPLISAQLSLWNQQGSNVIRGNLLVIPVAGTLVYVEPLYLQAASGKIPELKRVIVADPNTVKMADNLGLALVELFGDELLADSELESLATFGGAVTVEGALAQVQQAAASVDAAGAGASIQILIDQANRQFDSAQSLARQGDWAGYGVEIESLRRTLEQLAATVGVDTAAAEGEEPPAGDDAGGESTEVEDAAQPAESN